MINFKYSPVANSLAYLEEISLTEKEGFLTLPTVHHQVGQP
jgi:hypothetical protein